MSALLGNSEPSFSAQGIRILLLFLKVKLALVELLSVDIRNGIGYDMTVQMILVLMYSDQGLMRREKSVGECLPNFKALHWSDLFILMEGNHVMCIHPAGVLFPEFLLAQESLIHACRSNRLL